MNQQNIREDYKRFSEEIGNKISSDVTVDWFLSYPYKKQTYKDIEKEWNEELNSMLEAGQAFLESSWEQNNIFEFFMSRTIPRASLTAWIEENKEDDSFAQFMKDNYLIKYKEGVNKILKDLSTFIEGKK